ncbi:putative glycoprotease family protein [Botrytis fragariae]|uniref:N(6)-L-threonylcarbamoyladenine synthase n=1 Tax=Botrytis fragariae TaxID=1964551 RepID=A0A8H6AXV3_9HELO|nr:putative glycoprotease family protein [Botrytis fragariae]KAF5875754.1 putative glycoprotease family protein [Botrytis fragariae]
MKSLCPLFRRVCNTKSSLCRTPKRSLLTLAIETSCDDTSVSIVEKHANNSATLHFNSKVTSDNRSFGGVWPIAAHESHQKNLAQLVKEAIRTLPRQESTDASFENTIAVASHHGSKLYKKPDFITVTRGPGMRANLITGIDTAKGLAVAWQIPLLGVNHMQAHALTPRMVSALEAGNKTENEKYENDPAYPFLSLLVSGGHTMLVHSRQLCDHEILATTSDLAVGDMVDKTARDILPASVIGSASDVMYGRVMEEFAFPNPNSTYDYEPSQKSIAQIPRPTKYEWTLTPPYMSTGHRPLKSYNSEFSLSGVGSQIKRIMNRNPEMDVVERRLLAQETMRIAFEHLASRVILNLERPDLKETKTLVVSGGVAANQYLKYILRSLLDVWGHKNMRLVFPPPRFCTDNAAMIGWTGIEMWEAGWRSDLDILAARKWPIDPRTEGGILGLDGWKNEIV